MRAVKRRSALDEDDVFCFKICIIGTVILLRRWWRNFPPKKEENRAESFLKTTEANWGPILKSSWAGAYPGGRPVTACIKSVLTKLYQKVTGSGI